MPEFSIIFCCAPLHTMFKYVVLRYAEEISLCLSLSLSLKGRFIKKMCFMCLFVNCSNKIAKKIFYIVLFLHQIIESSMDNCIDKYRISINKMKTIPIPTPESIAKSTEGGPSGNTC